MIWDGIDPTAVKQRVNGIAQQIEMVLHKHGDSELIPEPGPEPESTHQPFTSTSQPSVPASQSPAAYRGYILFIYGDSPF